MGLAYKAVMLFNRFNCSLIRFYTFFRYFSMRLSNIFWSCLRIGIAILFFLFSPLFICAQPKPAHQPQRQELFHLADEALYFILYQAYINDGFRSSLKPDELGMMELISVVLDDVHRLRFLEKNKILPYQSGDPLKPYQYVYVDHINRTVSYRTNYTQTPKLIESTDQQTFILKPGDEPKSAKTGEGFADPIYLNLNHVNSANDYVDFARAVGILIHEYGHKIVRELKNQGAIDRLQAKLEGHVRGLTAQHKLANGNTIHYLTYSQFPYQAWLDYGYYGETYDFENLRPRPENPFAARTLPIAAFDNQGSYFWAESDGKITNLTPTILAKTKKSNLISYTPDEYYQFIEHNIFLTSTVQVDVKSGKEVVIRLQSAQIQLVIPFMIPVISKKPDEVNVSARYFWHQTPYALEPINSSIGFSYSTLEPVVQTQRSSERQISPLFFLEAQLEKQEIKENKLYFSIKITGDRKALAGPLNFFNRVRVTVESEGGGIAYYEAPESFSKNEVFHFRIESIQNLQSQSLRVSNVVLIAEGNQFLDQKTQLEGQIFLADPIALNVPEYPKTQTKPVVLKSIQQKTKQSWKSIRFRDLANGEGRLRFVLQTDQILQTLQLDFSIESLLFAALDARDGDQYEVRQMTRPVSRRLNVTIDISDSIFLQRADHGRLVVEVDLNKLGPLVSRQIEQAGIHPAGFSFEISRVNLIDTVLELTNLRFGFKNLQVSDINLHNHLRINWEIKDPEFNKYARLVPLGSTQLCLSLFH
jgi:hypothetical protein